MCGGVDQEASIRRIGDLTYILRVERAQQAGQYGIEVWEQGEQFREQGEPHREHDKQNREQGVSSSSRAAGRLHLIIRVEDLINLPDGGDIRGMPREPPPLGPLAQR